MAKLGVHNLTMSLDGFVAGPDQSQKNPLGVIRGGELHGWLFATETGRAMFGGEGGLDDEMVRRGDRNIGATIMGRNMFGPVRGPWAEPRWDGWWGAVVPILLGSGERVFESLADLPERYECTSVQSSPAATHVHLARRGGE
jgi:hypothetical protein